MRPLRRLVAVLPLPRGLILVAAVILTAALGATSAGAESLVALLSSHRVSITSNYTGSSVVVFGAIERDAQSIARAGGYEVVVTVRGPRQAITVREKEARGPVWLNREQQKFPNAPAYLGVFASRPITEITTDPLRSRLRVGLEAIVEAPDFTLDRGTQDDPFRDALIRLKKREGLYMEVERGVTFLTPTLFRAGVPLPATAPPGNYDVDVTLFADTVVLARTQTNFELVKVGFEESVGELARDWSALYGISTAAVAVLFGWVANVIFRRD